MAFTHPLARAAQVFAAHAHDGAERQVLAIITTLELDPHSRRYNRGLVEKLSAAARDYIASADGTGKDAAIRAIWREWEPFTMPRRRWRDPLARLPVNSAIAGGLRNAAGIPRAACRH
jgi:hypothetical protein